MDKETERLIHDIRTETITLVRNHQRLLEANKQLENQATDLVSKLKAKKDILLNIKEWLIANRKLNHDEKKSILDAIEIELTNF